MSMIRVQLKGPGTQKSVLSDVPANLSFDAFRSLVRSKTGLAEDQQSLMVGFPPQLISTSDGNTPISILKIRNGDLVLVTDVATMERNLTDGAVEGKGGWQYPATISKSGMMIRKDMPRDNSCLFHCIALLCAGRSTNSVSASEMRDIISNLVATNHERYNATFLGMSNQQYQIMLRNPDFWGGAIELSIFAQNFETEIIAFDYHYLREDVFGEGSGYKRRVFIIFTGNHYDAIVYQPVSSSSEVLVFSSQDITARERARQFVETLHSAAVSDGKCTLQKEWRKQLRQPEKKGATFEGTGTGGMSSGTIATADTIVSTRTSNNNWSCDMCTMNNAPEADTCGICGARRVSQVTTSITASESKRGTVTAATDIAAPSSATSSVSESKLRSSTTAATPVATAAGSSSSTSNGMNDGFGPWQCPHCSFDNPRRSLRCDACNQSNPFLPRPANGSTTSGNGNASTRNNSGTTGGMVHDDASDVAISPGGSTGMLAADTAWTCDACTYRNPRRSALCSTCHTPNPSADDSDFGSVPLGSGDHDDSHSSGYDDRFISARTSSTSSNDGAGQPPPARRGIISDFFGAVQAESNAQRRAHLWQCPNCQYQNTNRHVAKCHRCLAANPFWEPLPSDPGACIIS